MTDFLLSLSIGAAGTLVATIFLVVNTGWRHAAFSGAPLPWSAILGMRLRGTPPVLVADAYVSLKKRGMDLDWTLVEATYLANRHPGLTSLRLVQLIEADRPKSRSSD